MKVDLQAVLLKSYLWIRRCVAHELKHEYGVKGTGRVYFVSATPGSGKTRLACYLATRYLKADLADFIVVVAPTEKIQLQWKADFAKKFGIQLATNWRMASARSDYQGVILTYQGLPHAAGFIMDEARRRRLYFILDEVHHVADKDGEQSWCKACHQIAEVAERILALTGTPWNSTDKISLVPYKDGKADPHFTYTYREAVARGTIRNLVCMDIDGNAEWISDGDLFQADLTDELSNRESRRRYRTLLSKGEWMRGAIIAARDELERVLREENPRAQCLIGCMASEEQWHIKMVADLVREITGEEPVVVHHKLGSKAAKALREFEKSSSRYLVCINMATEGYDNNRLQVGVFGSDYITMLFFQQFGGRFLRPDQEEQDTGIRKSATLFIAKTPELTQLAAIVHEDNRVALQEREEDELQGNGSGGGSSSGFIPLDSESSDIGAWLDGMNYTPEECQQAIELRDFFAKKGKKLTVPQSLRMVKSAGLMGNEDMQPDPPQKEPVVQEDDEDKWRQKVNKAINQLVFHKHGSKSKRHGEYKARFAAKVCGGQTLNTKSENLKKILELVKEELCKVTNKEYTDEDFVTKEKPKPQDWWQQTKKNFENE